MRRNKSAHLGCLIHYLSLKQQLPFVAGGNYFYQTLGNGWIFSLVPAEFGWSIRLYDAAPVGDAVDLTSLTPPLRGTPDPRDIFGWRFHNADNTAFA